MSISNTELQNILKQAFPNADIVLRDMVGDMNHYSLEISDKSFAGKAMVDQHRMVKAALSEVMKDKLHAITIKTKAV